MCTDTFEIRLTSKLRTVRISESIASISMEYHLLTILGIMPIILLAFII